ncbi:entericidin A/B family lipoprotein [Hirschia baltica]|uniref:Entericidin EcnAB n=1 Tax=Hirschia baltica (strain ATCC 49814 / DSM 5838 / IFAM 1418) TaxID=582402 RepID=C6XLB2_HIRBI|nr:entericidin A/B family lipoprotein [Hirschia baltica]ACT59711.1 Entericidin EcnAB [Hirschia baltica ATCC 49814]
MNTTIKTCLLAAFTLALTTACNTVEGVGKDVEAVGEKVSETADANKPE